MRRATRRDKTHAEIVKYLRDRYIHVEDMALAGDGFPDLITYSGRRAVFIEIKDELKSAVKFKQIEFMIRWPGPAGFAVGCEQAQQLAQDPENHALTLAQKVRLQKLVDEYPDRDRIALKIVLERMGTRW